MSEFKDGLHRMVNALKELEERARNLKNKNLADVIAAAHGRVKQIGEHPDLEHLDGKKDEQAPAPLQEQQPFPQQPPMRGEQQF